MTILVIDGQGGKMGKQIIERVSAGFPENELIAVGTNSIATSTMLKAGCSMAATGENAVLVACRKADVIIGPLGIVVADSLLGEVTERMAAAVGKSDAVKILIPLNRCDNLIAGISGQSAAELLDDALSKLKKLMNGENRA